jgi:hypothetical protein
LIGMSDAADYFLAHARRATRKARGIQRGAGRARQRLVARIYHLLAKEAAYGPNLAYIEDFRKAQRLERSVSRS